MRDRVAIAVCLLAALPLAAQPGCAKHRKTESALIDLERVWTNAYEKRDVATMSCLLAPEYRHTAYDGKVMNRAEVLARLAALSKEDATHHQVQNVKASLFGNVAVVYGDSRVTEADGTLLGVVRFTDVFVYRGGRWVAVAEHESRVGSPESKKD